LYLASHFCSKFAEGSQYPTPHLSSHCRVHRLHDVCLWRIV
jgi:hypothetical protein